MKRPADTDTWKGVQLHLMFAGDILGPGSDYASYGEERDPLDSSSVFDPVDSVVRSCHAISTQGANWVHT